MKPLIGITSSNWTNEHGWPYFRGYAYNAKAIVQAGGLPVLMPNGFSSEVMREIYERVDGILLSGGGDIDPAEYGEPRDPLSKEIDTNRDTLEIALARWAVTEDRPLLGICRGHQVLHVAHGGKLAQDVATQVQTDVKHDLPFSTPRSGLAHTVSIVPGSRLVSLIGEPEIEVNSLHHQVVTQAGDALLTVGTSADGLIEASEMPGKTFVLSVQWHPEDLAANHPHAAQLFSAFIAAARENMRARKVSG